MKLKVQKYIFRWLYTKFGKKVFVVIGPKDAAPWTYVLKNVDGDEIFENLNEKNL